MILMSRNNTLILFIFLLILFPVTSKAQKTDPYHSYKGGFGELIMQDEDLSIWWCKGAYKVMRDTPLPEKSGGMVNISAAKNEYEPFQLVIRPGSRIENLRISAGNLVNGENIISHNNLQIRKVEYVKVTKPTDSYGYSDYWPDPLPEVKGPSRAYGAENNAFWITVFVPSDTEPGIYEGTVRLKSPELSSEIPVRLEVFDFCLPDTTSLRSGFGLSVDKIAAYHNLDREEDIKETFDLYMKSFRDYRIAPYDPFYLYPVKEKTKGIYWSGGIYDYTNSYNGEYSFMIEDDNTTVSVAGRYKKLINIENGKRYRLRWNIKTGEDNQQYCILVEGFDREGKKLVFENRMEVFSGDSTWSSEEYKDLVFPFEVSAVSLSIFPVFRTATGENTGKIWLDNIVFSEDGKNNNLLMQGDFEVKPGDADIELDFSEFDQAGERYLDEFGFNSFRLYLKGMGSGTYYSRNKGVFEGFVKGSPVYDSLMHKYLTKMQSHLKEKGWLGKEYVYWFDEPGKKDYPFVRDGMETIKKSAPEISTFITENDPGPEIMDVTDITCTIFHRVDPGKAKDIVAGGQEYWSYLCTAPKYPWISEFIDHDAINMRMWLWVTYAYRLNGILIWSTNYWTSRSASPAGYLQNPWKEPASFVQGYGWPYGKQTVWGNGDGRFFYPPNKNPNTDKSKYIEGPVPSLRLEFLRQGIEDYEYLVMLENLVKNAGNLDENIIEKAENLLKIKGTLFNDGKDYVKDPDKVYTYRKEIARMITEIKINTR